MNRAPLLSAAAAAVLALTGCAGPDHGVVHAREFTPAHTVVMTTCHPVGKVTVCTPTPVFYGDDWELDVYASKDDHGWVNVDQGTYDACRVGMTYDRGDCR